MRWRSSYLGMCVVLQVSSFFFPQYFHIFEVFKFFGAFVLLNIFILVGLRARASLLQILLHAEVKGDTSFRAALCYFTDSRTSSADLRRVLLIKRKVAEHLTIMVLASLACLLYGLYRLGLLEDNERDFRWERKLENQPGIMFTIFRLVGVLAIFSGIRTFHVPAQ